VSDAATLQAEIAARVDDKICDNCETVSYGLGLKERPELFTHPRPSGWKECSNMMAIYKPCDDCKKGNSRAWVADIEPARFAAFYARIESNAFTIDVLRSLLPNNHPMFEKPPLGLCPDGPFFFDHTNDKGTQIVLGTFDVSLFLSQPFRTCIITGIKAGPGGTVVPVEDEKQGGGFEFL